MLLREREQLGGGMRRALQSAREAGRCWVESLLSYGVAQAYLSPLNVLDSSGKNAARCAISCAQCTNKARASFSVRRKMGLAGPVQTGLGPQLAIVDECNRASRQLSVGTGANTSISWEKIPVVLRLKTN